MKRFPLRSEFLIIKVSAVMNAAHVSQPANQPENQRSRSPITAAQRLHVSVIISWRAVWIHPKRSGPTKAKEAKKVTGHLLETDYLRKSNRIFTLPVFLWASSISSFQCMSLTRKLHTHDNKHNAYSVWPFSSPAGEKHISSRLLFFTCVHTHTQIHKNSRQAITAEPHYKKTNKIRNPK